MNTDVYFLIEHLQGELLEISYLLAAMANKISHSTGGQAVGLLLGEDVEGLSSKIKADKVLYFEASQLAEFTPESYLHVLSDWFEANKPGYLLFGHTSMGMDLASNLALKFNLPVINQCKTVSPQGEDLVFTCQIFGGKVMAEGVMPASSAVLTVLPGGYKPEEGMSDTPPLVEKIQPAGLPEPHIRLRQYIEPDISDVDISKEEILVSVGRGLQNQDDLELVEQLAGALHGAVSASRPLVDQGWLPASRLVGKSGKSVKPKLYLALGISGAPEHVEGMANSGLIVAVNTDPQAPIFETAQYGIIADMVEFIEALLEKIQSVTA